ncbi:amino acid/amide ABC transporter membrane protein 2 (HAAT family) [Stackebrandtia endophytica]|uniref:Amino acid/amide ABC transporter membrane protein 2 (HAAT family) n=1 Tax=Stackebrandtia endophytica TaxID=1496996 RepID=A0A543AZZ2_9ACTN|nr:branched-chain amino acid ABC transporter permease [Stackebrandtia endophytica]TQL78153.1 amino acid/amide ABC transporter membrane protein 2 (HAAT family) [Stackebrandtia endophytica]
MTDTLRSLSTRFLDARLVGVLIVALLATMPFVVDAYTLSSLSEVLAMGLLAVSVAVMAGNAGLPSLGQVAPYAVGMYTTVVLIRSGMTVGPVLLLASAGAAALFCLVLGFAVIRTRGVVFLMLTLAIGELTYQVSQRWTDVTGGTDGSGRYDATQAFWGTEPMVKPDSIYWYCLAVAAIVVLIVARLVSSTPGKLIRGIRDNEARMRADGHRVGHYLLALYIGAGVVAGIGGSLMASSQRMVFPSDSNFNISALVLMAVVIGGAASLNGAIVGLGLVMMLRDWSNTAVAEHSPLVLGVLFIVVVYLLPGGFAGAASRIGLRQRKEAT